MRALQAGRAARFEERCGETLAEEQAILLLLLLILPPKQTHNKTQKTHAPPHVVADTVWLAANPPCLCGQAAIKECIVQVLIQPCSVHTALAHQRSYSTTHAACAAG